MYNSDQLKIVKLQDGIKFCIRVIPNSSKCELAGIFDDCLKIKLTVPPIEGRANKECIKFLSKLLNVPKTSIEIISGQTSKNKTIFIWGNSDELSRSISSLVYDK